MAAIVAAGGMVLGVDPLADPGDPHVVVAYRVTAGASTYAVLEAVRAVEADTAVGVTGLIPWTPEEVGDDASLGD